MVTLLRRLFWLALVGGGGFACWSLWQRQQQAAPAAPEWPPLDATTSNRPVAATAPATTVAGPASSADAKWVAPVDGACPDGYPVKANDNSGIYHVPGGRFYDRTVPERCYAVGTDAETDGYRAAKA